MKIVDTIEGKLKLNLSFKSPESRVLTDIAVIPVTIKIDIRKLNKATAIDHSHVWLIQTIKTKLYQ